MRAEQLWHVFHVTAVVELAVGVPERSSLPPLAPVPGQPGLQVVLSG
jgi:hypothetical protein